MFSKKRVNPARRLSAGFAAVIVAGTLLLMLPVSSKSHEAVPFLTALFTSTSATCVTGLVIVETGAYFSWFGQMVILALIQIGGLGFMLILSVAYIASDRHIGLRSRLMIAQTLGMESVSGAVRITKHALRITGIVEGAGAVILALRFIPGFGIKGIWYGIFHSVSAFCNAGFDILGRGNSITPYKDDPIVLITISLLIIIGGLGFIVWEDVLVRRKRMSVYSRIVLIMTGLLIVLGAIGFFIMEHNNAQTIGRESVPVKILNALFQSVTTRTAGFDTIGQRYLTEPSKFLSIVLMMLGGASGSTAGGIKIGTAVVLFFTFKSVLIGRSNVVIMKRSVPQTTIIHAMTILGLWLVLTTVSGMIISWTEGLPILDCMYETASAYDTVGLTCGVMEYTGTLSKCIMIVLMYFGRVGIMTIGVTFISARDEKSAVQYPEGSVMVG